MAAVLAPLFAAGRCDVAEGSAGEWQNRIRAGVSRCAWIKGRGHESDFHYRAVLSAPSGTFLHIDAYRLSSVAEFRDLALEDFVAESITAVEWGDIVEQDFPHALSINFEFVENEDNSRKLTFSAAAEKWEPVLASLKNEV